MPRDSLSQRLAATKAMQSSDAIKRAATAVADDIFKRNVSELTSNIAGQVAAQYQEILESAIKKELGGITGMIDKLGARIGEIETGPGLESLEPVADMIGELKQEIHNIDIPAPPAVTIPQAEPIKEVAVDYDMTIQRDENGFIKGVKAKARK